MESSISGEQFGEAILGAVENGAYPENEDIIAAELPSSAFPALLNRLQASRREIEEEVKNLSRQHAIQLDSWIADAQQLSLDIQDSKAAAQRIVNQSNEEEGLGTSFADASSKANLLRVELSFNETLASALEQIQSIQQSIDTIQSTLLRGAYGEAIKGVLGVERHLDELQGLQSTAAVRLLHGKVSALREDMCQALDEQWNRHFVIDRENSSITFKEVAEEPPVSNISVVIENLNLLNLFGQKIENLCHEFEALILRPLLDKVSSAEAPKLEVDGDRIRLSRMSLRAGIHPIFEALHNLLTFITSHLLRSISNPLMNNLMPSLTTQLKSNWLSGSIPSGLDGIPEFGHVLASADEFADYAEELGVKGTNDLRDWVAEAPRLWVTRMREVSLDKTRKLLLSGIDETRTVERVETQKVSREDGMFIPAANGDDWDAQWSDDEESHPKPTNPLQAEGEDEDEAVNAWGLDEDIHDVDDQEVKPTHEPTGGEDDGAEAWGWGDEEHENKASEPPDNPRVQSTLHQKPNGHRSRDSQSSRNVTLRETYTITAFPEGILEIIGQIVSDAEKLTTSQYEQSPVAPLAPALFTLPSLILAMYRAAASTFYSRKAGGNMFLYNDSLWLSEQVSNFAEERGSQISSPRLQGRLRLDSDIQALEGYAKRAYGKEMESQRTIITDLLEGAQGFANCTVHPFATECDNAINSTVDWIRHTSGQWKNILSRSATLQSLGSLLSTVTNKLIVDISDMSDISEAESQKLSSICNRVINLEDLFLPDPPPPGAAAEKKEAGLPLTAVYCPSWLKFQYLANILESSLADIKYLWSEGELKLEFSADEVVDLIEALFADSEHRRRAIGEIRRSTSSVR